jgi:hypothetical protein
VIDSFTEEELANLTPEQIDERERELIKQKKDAIQESSTEEVDVQEPAQDSEEVGEGDTAGETTVESEEEVQAQDEETAEEEVTDEEVSEEEIGDLETLLGIEPEPVTEQEQPTEEVMEEAGEEVIEEAPVPEAEVVEEEVVEEVPTPETEVVEEEVVEEPIAEAQPETKEGRKKKTLAEELAEIMNYTVEEAQEEMMKDDFIGYLDEIISTSDMFEEFRYRLKPLERIKKKYLAEQAKKETTQETVEEEKTSIKNKVFCLEFLKRLFTKGTTKEMIQYPTSNFKNYLRKQKHI